MATRKRRAHATRQAATASARRGPSRLSLLIIVLVALSLVLGAFGFYYQNQAEELAQQVLTQPLSVLAVGEPTPQLQNNKTVPQATKATKQNATAVPPAAGKLDQTLNVLLLGSDQRPNDPVWRTDVIMIAFLDTSNGRAAVLSLPRDLYVNIPTRGWDRINIADFWGEFRKYPGGGPGLLKQVVQDNFGIRIDKYARVNFDGFTRIVDTLGGIDVNVPCALEDDFIDPTSPTGFRHFQVEAGVQHMNGATALMFVRQRHGSGDISRAQRQQRVIFALRDKMLSPDILPKIPQLYDQMQDIVTTDFGPLDIPRLIQIGTNIKPGNIRGRVIDETMWQFWTTPDGKSVLVFDKKKVRAAIDDLFNAPPIQESQVICY